MTAVDHVRADPWTDQRRAIDDALGAMVARELSDLPPAIDDAIRYALVGGKRIRGILLLAAYDAACRDAERHSDGEASRADNARPVSGMRRHDATGLAAAVEIVHAYSLVHDDLPCMDDDDVRRGRPTVHKVFGVRAATVAGIVMVPLAVRATVAGAQAAGLDPSGAADAVARLMNAAGAAGMIGGQLLDLIAEGQPTTVERLDEIHRGKTGALIAVSAGLGGLAGGAGAGAVARLEAFGLAIGLAFQITDDVLDVTASSATLGKTAGRDVALNKSTYPALVGVPEAEARARGLVEEACAGLASVGLLTDDLGRLARLVVERRS